MLSTENPSVAILSTMRWIIAIVVIAIVVILGQQYFGERQVNVTASPQARSAQSQQPQWELVTTFNNAETYRLRVHGGWLYRYRDGLAFVPE